MSRIIFTDPDHTRGRVIHDEGDFFGPLPPLSGEFRPIYDRLIAEGVGPEPYVPPLARAQVRTIDADVFIAALEATGGLTAMNLAAETAAKAKDRYYWQRRAEITETNPKLARLAAEAGVDVRAVFDLAATNL